MKTTMQQLIDKHNKEFYKMNFLKWLSINRKELLEAEKQQIIDAYAAGRASVHDSREVQSSEEYYLKTFKP